MYLYCIVIVILYCTVKEAFLYRNFQLGPRKSVRCYEVSGKNCPLHRGFFIKILYETNPFLKKCPLEGGVCCENVRYREVSLWHIPYRMAFLNSLFPSKQAKFSGSAQVLKGTSLSLAFECKPANL